jgi:hypothetical protein
VSDNDQSKSSCRPARLRLFKTVTNDMGDGLRRRIYFVEAALRHYRATSDRAFRLDGTIDTDEILTAWVDDLVALGQFADDVGLAFERLHALDTYMGRGIGIDPYGIFRQPYDEVLAELGDRAPRDLPDGAPVVVDSAEPGDPIAATLTYLGFTTTSAEGFAHAFGDMFTDLSDATKITITISGGEILFFQDGAAVAQLNRTQVVARLLFPGQTSAEIAGASRWLGRLGAAVDFAGAAWQQWQTDQFLPIEQRVARAGLEGAGVAGGAWLFGSAGALAGGACGPGAPVCSVVLGTGGAIAGALGGAFLGDKFAQSLPGMEEKTPREQWEAQAEGFRDEIAQDDGQLSGDAAKMDAMTTLTASDLALAETSSSAPRQQVLTGLLPYRGTLEDTIRGYSIDPPTASPAPPTTYPDNHP